MVAPATYPENLSIGISLTIAGSNASTTIIDGGNANTVVTVSGGRVTFSKLTVQHGYAFGNNSGGGINNLAILTIRDSIIGWNIARLGGGGGIFNYGTLAISKSTITGNSAIAGGGIENYGGKLTLTSSTISGNQAIPPGCPHGCGSSGGGILNNATMTMANSTVARNVAIGGLCRHPCPGRGGGIFNQGTLTISNTTVSGNGDKCIFCSQVGGGIWGGATLQNSIVADNNHGNCYGTMTSEGYNLSSDNTCNFSGPGDLNNIDPMLGPLQNNGGPTQAMALPSGSPATDAGNPTGCTDGRGHLLKTDQRGKPRPDKEDAGGCDMGAYESQSD